MPDINCRYLEDPHDRERMREALRKSFEFMEYASFSAIVEEPISPTREEIKSDEALDAWMMENVDIGQHLSGTCKMGPASDPMAVVDQYGRVHGVENLRVADASIMPNVVRANTNATTILIGERIADWIGNQTTVAPQLEQKSYIPGWTAQPQSETAPSPPFNYELQRSLDELKEALATAAESEIPEPKPGVVQEAIRLITALHDQVRREYMVYLMANGSIAIDTRGTKPDGAFITLSADGSAFCSSRSKGESWRRRYDASTTLPDETLLENLRSLNPAGA